MKNNSRNKDMRHKGDDDQPHKNNKDGKYGCTEHLDIMPQKQHCEIIVK
jgi:hypothetical protein